jgi:peptidoglycan/LPS O-acetylase OafA/YrhL
MIAKPHVLLRSFVARAVAASEVTTKRARADATERLVWVDALRGAAALVVVLHHARTLFHPLLARLHETSALLHATVLFISERNVEAVWGFFVLSGFSIRLSVQKHGLRGNVRAYCYQRARRILPLYWLALLLSAFVARELAPAPPASVSIATLVGNLLFLQTANGIAGQWFVPYAANGPLWSLSFEMFFYLAYPFLMHATGYGYERARRRKRMAWVVAACALGQFLNLVAPTPFSLFLAAGFVWYAGVELAECWLGAEPSWPRRVLLAALLLTAFLRFGLGWLGAHGLFVGVAALLLGGRAHSRAPNTSNRAFCALAWVGGVSYGLYLLHVPVMRAVIAIAGQTIPSLGCAIVSTVGLAFLSERLLTRAHRRATIRYSRRSP